MDNVEDIDKNAEHFVTAALCLECKNKWIAVIKQRTQIFSLECHNCKAHNSFVSFLPPDYSSLPTDKGEGE